MRDENDSENGGFDLLGPVPENPPAVVNTGPEVVPVDSYSGILRAYAGEYFRVDSDGGVSVKNATGFQRVPLEVSFVVDSGNRPHSIE
jgi:hypothetical protein